MKTTFAFIAATAFFASIFASIFATTSAATITSAAGKATAGVLCLLTK